MLKNIGFALQYLSYKLRSCTLHDIQPPFVYEFVEEVILAHKEYYDFHLINTYRNRLYQENAFFAHTDLGASKNSAKLRISEYAKRTCVSDKFGKLLFRIVNRIEPKVSLELGTGFGLSALYQHFGWKKGKFITLEGSPGVAKLAKQKFDALKVRNIEIREGDFKDSLPTLLESLAALDYVFFDGNHREGATLEYFEQCKKKAHSETVFIFDDIHWSMGMRRAWTKIKSDKAVTCSIDLFFMGIVFFKKGMTKADYLVRF